MKEHLFLEIQFRLSTHATELSKPNGASDKGHSTWEGETFQVTVIRPHVTLT